VCKMSSNNDCDYTFRVVIVGDQTVGKTSLLLRFVDNVFIAENVTTNGANMKSRIVQLGKKTVQLNIMDTCGQELFRTISRSIYHNADAVIVVYDQGNEKSFNNVQFWLREVDKYSNNPNCHKVVVGNKTDSQKLVVTTEQGKAFAAGQGIEFLDTSAKDDVNVDTLFASVAQGVGNKIHPSEDWNKVRVARSDSREPGQSGLGNSQQGRKRTPFCSLV